MDANSDDFVETSSISEIYDFSSPVKSLRSIQSSKSYADSTATSGTRAEVSSQKSYVCSNSVSDEGSVFKKRKLSERARRANDEPENNFDAEDCSTTTENTAEGSVSHSLEYSVGVSIGQSDLRSDGPDVSACSNSNAFFSLCTDVTDSELEDRNDLDNSSGDCLNDSTFDIDTEFLYSGSTITTGNIEALLLAFFKKHRCSEIEKNDMLKILKLALPVNNNCPPSAYLFDKKQKEHFKVDYTHHKHCSYCLKKVVQGSICTNEDCQHHEEEVPLYLFFTLPLKAQIQRLIQENWENIEAYREKLRETPNAHDRQLRDIQDGAVYQKFATADKNKEKKIFSLVISSDGAPVLKSRKFNVWPLMCFLVELPPEVRYKYCNVVLTGLWYGKSKPDMKLFLKSFVSELTECSQWCEFNDLNGCPVHAVLRIQSVVPDLPAKAILLNTMQYNGRFGCGTCKHPGEYVREFRSRLYRYTKSEKRTAEDSFQTAEVAESTSTTIFGIKGQSVFGKLVALPDNAPIDWMHCVCEGVLKRQLFKLWFDNEHSRESFSLCAFKENLDEIFLSIKVPHDFTRKPRSFNDVKHWKASEFRFFVLFSGLPCLRTAVDSDIFPPDYFIHFALLVTALRHLHSLHVKISSTEVAQVLIDNFVRLLPSLYNERQCTYNSHALLHLPDQVLDNGPLSFTSAFVFESFIAHLKNLFTGTRGIPQQIVEKLVISQSYKTFVTNNCKGNEEVEHLASKLISSSSNTKMINNGISLYEPIQPKVLTNYSNVVEERFGTTEVFVSHRMRKEHIVYHSLEYSRKGNSCSYIVEAADNVFGKVICYIVDNNNNGYALLEPYQRTGGNVCQGLRKQPQDVVLQTIIEKGLIGEEFIEVEDALPTTARLIECTLIKNRCLYIPNENGKGYLTTLDTTYEHD